MPLLPLPGAADADLAPAPARGDRAHTMGMAGTRLRLLLFLNAHALDVLTFLWAASLWSIAGESNAVMRELWAIGGAGAIILARGTAVGLWAWRMPRHRRSFTFGIWIGLVGALSNATAIALH